MTTLTKIEANRLNGQLSTGPQTAEGKQAARLLLGDGHEERTPKYERHLHTLLTSTFHELEWLQARREGEPVLPPTVADVTVTVDAGPG